MQITIQSTIGLSCEYLERPAVLAEQTGDNYPRCGRCLQGVTGCGGTIPTGTWWRSLYQLAGETGERVAAILRARWAGTARARGLVWIPAKCRKGEDRRMLYTISAELLARRPGGELLFLPWHQGSATASTRYKSVLKRPGLSTENRSIIQRAPADRTLPSLKGGAEFSAWPRASDDRPGRPQSQPRLAGLERSRNSGGDRHATGGSAYARRSRPKVHALRRDPIDLERGPRSGRRMVQTTESRPRTRLLAGPTFIEFGC